MIELISGAVIAIVSMLIGYVMGKLPDIQEKD